MENSFFIKFEIFVFLASFLYIIYYLFDKFYRVCGKVKAMVSPAPKEKLKKGKAHRVKLDNDSPTQSKHQKTQLSSDQRDKLNEILKRVKVNVTKWYFDSAKHLIVEWLALDKFNKELNLYLASIYEKEEKYKNAEFIYKDLADVLENDFEVLKKLSYIYAMQWKYEKSLKICEKIHKKKLSDLDVVNMLCGLSFDLKEYKKCLKYTKEYLREKPRDVEKMFMQAHSLEVLEKVDEAHEMYKKILSLQPYNTLARDKILKYWEN